MMIMMTMMGRDDDEMMMMMLHDDDADNDDGACSGIGIAILSLKKNTGTGGRAWGIKSPSTTTRVTPNLYTFQKRLKRADWPWNCTRKDAFQLFS